MSNPFRSPSTRRDDGHHDPRGVAGRLLALRELATESNPVATLELESDPAGRPSARRVRFSGWKRLPAFHEIKRRAVAGAVLLARWTWRIILDNSWLSLALVVSAAMAAAIVITIVLPGYSSPSSRITTSKFGYPSLFRKLHKPFPVPATRLTRRVLGQTVLGEGLVRTEPYVVPIIPMGRLTRVLVKEGDYVKKGQLVAEVDSTKATIKVGAARAALETAEAELKRVRIGSAYVLTYERPTKDQIHVQYAEKAAELQRQIIAMSRRLNEKGYAPKQELLMMELELTKIEQALQESKFNLGMSSKGVAQSEIVAQSAVREAELALKHRETELADHKIFANADGQIERCLVHEGEYNQDPGKPGFLIAAASWFEANFDQGTYDRVRVGGRADVRLEAYPGRVFHGKVTWVNPFVTYDLGGPESTRPIRPMGTGAPEWPATFAARVQVEESGVPIIPGMTGFCVIRSEDEVDCVRREAVSSVTGGQGIVYLIHGETFEPREVTLGVVDGDWIQVRKGLAPTDELILDGYQVLEPKDRIKVVPEAEAEGDD